MKRDAIYYVAPLEAGWLLRATGAAPQRYPTIEETLAATQGRATGAPGVSVLASPRAELDPAQLSL